MASTNTTTTPNGNKTESSTTTVAPASEVSSILESWLNSENIMTLGLSVFLLIGTFAWICIWYKRKQKEQSFRKKSRDLERIKSSGRSPTKSDRRDDLPQLPKTPSVASIQSTGSNYYDQLMGSGNIPKVKSISQYGALLAQQEPPPQ